MIPIDVEIVPQAVLTFGLVGHDTVEGLGLNTFGFLWPVNGIWQPCCANADEPEIEWEECCL